MMFCTTCGASNMDDAQFCVNCGDSLCDEDLTKKSPLLKGLRETFLFKRTGFLQPLFDFSFNHFITPKIIKLLYGLSIFLAGLVGVLLIIFGFGASTGFGIFTLLVGAPLVFLLVVIWSRICLELIIAVFRIAETLATRGEKSEAKDGIQWNV